MARRVRRGSRAGLAAEQAGRESLLPWAAIVLAAPPLYGALWLGGLGHAQATALSFAVMPLAGLHAMGRPLALGRLDRTLLAGIAANLVAFLYRAPRVIAEPEAFSHLALGLLPGNLVGHLVHATLVVGSVDLFTRRVIQHEAHDRWGAWVGGWLAVAAWLVGHVREYVLYLGPQVGLLEGAGYLVVTGVAGALLYARWRNVLGFVIGHVGLNVAVGLLVLAL